MSATVRGPRLPCAGIALLVAAAFVLPVVLMRGKSATFDEVFHLPAGYSYLASGTVTIAGHPPLVMELCALPLLPLDVKLPGDARTLHDPARLEAERWSFMERFLFVQDADRLLFLGRIPAVLLLAALAGLIALWAARLWGPRGALLSVFLCVFDPTMIAHGQLVTTDVGLAFFSVLALLALRAYVARPTLVRLAPAGVTLGLALGAKYSALVLVPVFALLLCAAAWTGAPPSAEGLPRVGTAVRRAASSIAALGAMLAVAYVTLWVIYLLPADPLFYLKGIRRELLSHRPDYLYFLRGEFREEGWRSYLLVAWLVKTPLPSLVLQAAAIPAFLRGRRAGWLDEAFLIVPALAYALGYSLFADNLGVRYLIPAFPFLFVFAGRLAAGTARPGRLGAALFGALLLWQVGEFAAVWPDHLSYFNQLTGVPPRGTEWLDDSNVDWGQGLIQLRDYLARTGLEDFTLAYFGSGSPEYYGIRPRKLYASGPEDLLGPRPPPGTYILSAHYVARLRAQLAAAYGPGNWLARAALRDVVGHAWFVYDVR